MTRCLHRRAAVETPKGQIGKRRRLIKFLDVRFAAQLGYGLLAVKSDVLKFVLCHGSPFWGR